MKHYAYESPFKMKDEKGMKYTLEVKAADYAENPREWKNFCTMICWHNRYFLGDKHHFSNPLLFMSALYEGVMGENWFDNHKIDNWSDIFKALQESNLILIKAIYLYDHSGITVSTSRAYPYNDHWDSCITGFIYVTKKTILEETGLATEETWKDVAEDFIKAEMEVYDQYLRGDVYGYTLTRTVVKQEKCPHCGEVIREYEDEEYDDSSWGFYGDCLEDNGILDHLGGLEFVED